MFEQVTKIKPPLLQSGVIAAGAEDFRGTTLYFSLKKHFLMG